MKRKNILSTVLLICFALIFLVSAFFLVREITERRRVVTYVSSIQDEYVPQIPPPPAETPENDESETDSDAEAPATAERVNTDNPSVQKLIADYPDTVGWLTVTGAEISHPFVHTDDNYSYLWADLDGNYIRGGTLFMDCYNSRDFSDKITVIYGHNMRDGTMFGQLLKYLDFEYLLAHPDVYISHPDRTEHYTIAACFVADGADNIVFDRIGTTENIQDVVDFIYSQTDVNSDTPLDGESNLLVLSTCHRSYETARTFLICIPD